MGVKLTNNIPKIQTEIKVKLAQGINNALAYGVSEAQDLVPVLTGFTKAHIGITKVATPNDLSGEARSLSPWSGFINFGTSKMAAQPFWTVAWLLVRNKFSWLLKSGFVGLTKGSSAGPNIIRAALQEYFGPSRR